MSAEVAGTSRSCLISSSVLISGPVVRYSRKHHLRVLKYLPTSTVDLHLLSSVSHLGLSELLSLAITCPHQLEVPPENSSRELGLKFIKVTHGTGTSETPDDCCNVPVKTDLARELTALIGE